MIGFLHLLRVAANRLFSDTCCYCHIYNDMAVAPVSGDSGPVAWQHSNDKSAGGRCDTAWSNRSSIKRTWRSTMSAGGGIGSGSRGEARGSASPFPNWG